MNDRPSMSQCPLWVESGYSPDARSEASAIGDDQTFRIVSLLADIFRKQRIPA
jgi:hypothetical protein